MDEKTMREIIKAGLVLAIVSFIALVLRSVIFWIGGFTGILLMSAADIYRPLGE